MTGAAPPPPPGPFTGVGLAELAHRLRSGATDPLELVEQALTAAEQSQAALNAYVTIDVEGARSAAATAQDELGQGVDRGPLHGIPVAVKDLVDTAGLRTTMGSRHFADHVPMRDAAVVTALRAAGAVIVGKTTTHEFAYGPTGDRAANGPGRNPVDPTRMAGGSSAGSAAAVAAGLVPLAIGTDTGGSVRIPAALCGVVGLRPSMGLISVEGVFPLAPSYDAVGVLTADVAGAALALAHLSTVDVRDGATMRAPAPLRIGVVEAEFFDRLDPDVRAAMVALRARLAGAGVQLVPVPVPDAAELMQTYRIIQSAEAAALHADRLRDAPELFDPEVLDRLRAATQVSRAEQEQARGRLDQLRATAAERLTAMAAERLTTMDAQRPTTLDALLLPTVPILAPPVGARDLDLDVGGGWTSPRDALLAHTAPWGVLDLPAISIPVGTGRGGLPIGAQLVGHRGADGALLAVAAVVERLAHMA